jgi:hypothetical protein
MGMASGLPLHLAGYVRGRGREMLGQFGATGGLLTSRYVLDREIEESPR